MPVKKKQIKNNGRKHDGYMPPHKDTILFKELKASPAIYNAVVNQAMEAISSFRALSQNVNEKNQNEYANLLDERVVDLTLKMLEIDNNYDYTVEEGVKALVKAISGDENLAHVSNIWLPGMPI